MVVFQSLILALGNRLRTGSVTRCRLMIKSRARHSTLGVPVLQMLALRGEQFAVATESLNWRLF